MTPERHRQVGELFAAVLDRPPAERDSYLSQACSGDEALRSELNGLLRHYQDTGNFLAPLGEDGLPSQPTPLLIGSYTIRRQLGEGGMGTVYLAEQAEPFRREVALKVIRPGMGSKSVIARFEAERRTLAMMDHPNIAHVFDAGTTTQGLPYFAMELVEGVPLTLYCMQKQCTVAERLSLFIQVCQAIQYAHQKGIIHRDIKPSNVLVREIEGKPIPKVIDFGLSKALDAGLSDASMLTHVGTIVGTINYMSPEQADPNGNDIDTRSDVYSLGVLLYELLTGDTPLKVSKVADASYLRLLHRVREEEPKPPSTVSKAHLDPELDWITLKALAKERSRRFETVNGMVRDLQRYLAGDAVEAAPPSKAYKARKFVAKHRFGLAMGASLALVLTGALIMTTWMTVRARRAELEATAVSNFLRTDLLAQADPGNQVQPNVAPDGNLTVRTALDRAAGAVGGKFNQTPLVEAAIRQTISDAYRGLGVYPKAEDQERRVLDLRRQALGENDRSTLRARYALATLISEQGDYRQAEPLFAGLLAARRRHFGENDPDTIQSLGALAQSYRLQGKQPQAITLFTTAEAASSRVLGPEHRDTVAIMENLGRTEFEAAQLKTAESMLARVLDIRRRTLREEHPDTVRSMEELGAAYQEEKKYALAEGLYTRALAVQRRIYGVAHPDTLITMYNLAQLYKEEKRYPEALALLEENRAARGKVWAPDHPRTLRLLGSLADLYEVMGRHEEAVRMDEDVWARQRRLLGEEHPDALDTVLALADLYAPGDPVRAETLYQKSIDGFRRTLGPLHGTTITALIDWAGFLIDQKRFAHAATLLQGELDAVGDGKALDNPMHRFHLMSLLGSANAGQQHWSAAEPLLRDGYEGMVRTASAAGDREDVAQAGDMVIKAYEQWGKQPAETAAWKQLVAADRMRLATLQR